MAQEPSSQGNSAGENEKNIGPAGLDLVQLDHNLRLTREQRLQELQRLIRFARRYAGKARGDNRRS